MSHCHCYYGDIRILIRYCIIIIYSILSTYIIYKNKQVICISVIGHNNMYLDVIITNHLMFFSWLEMNNTIPVYNSASVSKSVSNKELLDLGMKIIEQYPFDEMMWRPSIKFTMCFYYYYICTIIEQVLPAIFFDALLDLIGKPHKYENVYQSTYHLFIYYMY